MTWQHRVFALFLLVVVPPAGNATAQTKTPDADRRLQQWLKKFPQADANGDGVLTEQEARAYKKTRKAGKTAEKPTAGDKAISPTQANISYGPHERNKLDFWRAESDRATPVLVFFHGGSFKAGDKANVLTRSIFGECLAAGISVVSANYRFSSDAPFPASMHDGARAVQFVRSKAKEWNIDPAHIAVSGTSAGATLALWIALHDDLADPSSPDPVARQSTRVQCASPHKRHGRSGTSVFQEARRRDQTRQRPLSIVRRHFAGRDGVARNRRAGARSLATAACHGG